MGYKTTCVKCGGSNFYVTEENGKKYCFNCTHFEVDNAAKVTLTRSPRIEEIRALYTELAIYYHSCMDTPQLKYLEQRGIEEETVKKLKIGYCSEDNHVLYIDSLAKEAGIGYNGNPFLANRIIFPYWRGNQVIDMRGRLFKGEGDTYKSPFNGSYFRGADFSFGDKVTDQEVIITEGEIKAIVPSQHDLDVRALPGIRSNRLITLKPKQKTIICFDNQRYHRIELLNAIKKLAQRLENPFIATLPLLGENKQDIDGYIIRYGIDSFKKIINSSLPYDIWQKYINI